MTAGNAAQVVEVVPVAPEWAFARTSSAGKQTIHAIKKTTDEANQVSDLDVSRSKSSQSLCNSVTDQ